MPECLQFLVLDGMTINTNFKGYSLLKRDILQSGIEVS
jgi:hypothetical protein